MSPVRLSASSLRRALALTLCLAAAARTAHAQHGDAGGGPSASPPSSESMRADLAAFRTEFMAREKSFAPAARAEAERRLAALEQALPTTSAVHFEVTLAQVAALADNGHTHIAPGGLAMRHNRAAVRFTPFGESFRVLRATPAQSELLGARLVAVDGHDMTALIAAARTLAGGTAAWRDRAANVAFESPELLHELGMATSPDAALYTFELRDGRRVERRLTGERGRTDSPPAATSRWLSPDVLDGEGTSWRALLTVDATPWALREPSAPFRWRAAPEIQGLVIQMRQTFDAPGQTVQAFAGEMRAEIERSKPTNVVLDMRHNGGGDLTKARAFMQALPGLVPGRVFVLTSLWTFSAAISSVGYLKQAGGEKVVIVGEEVGDRLEFFAEGRGTELPNSKMRFGLATQRHDYKTGCRGFTDCHFNVKLFPIAVPTLAPEVAAPWTFEAYAAGRDPGMEAVGRAVGQAMGR
jgi:hypothetical protein